MSEVQKDFIFVPNAQEQDYYRLSEGNHTIVENGDILMVNVKLFHLNWESLWRKGNFYPETPQTKAALQDWCEKFKDGVFGEMNNPDLDKMKHLSEREKYVRVTTLDPDRRVVDFTNLRLMTELNGQPFVTGSHLVVDVRFHGETMLGQELCDYLKNGGLFRFSLRSTCRKEHGPKFTWVNHIHDLITFDIITQEIDEQVAADNLKREAERAGHPQVCSATELKEEPADEAMINPPAELHPKTQALINRALPKSRGEDVMYLEKRDPE